MYFDIGARRLAARIVIAGASVRTESSSSWRSSYQAAPVDCPRPPKTQFTCTPSRPPESKTSSTFVHSCVPVTGGVSIPAIPCRPNSAPRPVPACSLSVLIQPVSRYFA